MDVFAERNCYKSVARVATGLAKFGHDVFKGQVANFPAQVNRRTNQLNAGSNQFSDALIQVLRQTKKRWVSFGMDRCVVQWIYAVRNAQKAGCLLESLLAETRDAEKFFARTEQPFAVAVFDNSLCKCRPNPGNA